MEPYHDLQTYDGRSGFAGALGKIVRARYQWRDLNERFREHVEKGRPGLPKREWGVLIGELVHNLRSALYHAVYTAAEAPTRRTEFPICVTEKQWREERRLKLDSVPEEVVRVIERTQPFKVSRPEDAKRHVLYLLDELWNHDKHRVLHMAAIKVEAFDGRTRMLAVVFDDPLEETSILKGEKVLDVLAIALQGVPLPVTKIEFTYQETLAHAEPSES